MRVLWPRRASLAAIVLALAALACATLMGTRLAGPSAGVIRANGRIEATEIDVVTKLPGQVENILVSEGDFVQAGQPLARMKLEVLEAQLDEARAHLQKASNSVSSARAQVVVRQCEKLSAEATLTQRETDLDGAQRRLKRSEILANAQITSAQELDEDRARVRNAEAALKAAKAQVAAAQAAIEAAGAELIGMQSTVVAAQATLTRVEADMADTELKSPRNARLQSRFVQPGDLLGAGVKVLNLVDLSDVCITFVLPERTAERVALDSEVRIVFEAAPQTVISAKVSSIVCQPKPGRNATVTDCIQQGSIFRVRAKIPCEIAQKHLRMVKTGLSGVAWLKLDPHERWPKKLTEKSIE